MSLINCNPLCATQKVPQRYDLAACGDVLRAFGQDSMIFFHCTLLSHIQLPEVPVAPETRVGLGVPFDITNLVHWQWAIDNELITRTPSGSFALGDTSDEVAGEDGCGNLIIDFSEVTWEYETFQTATDKSDEKYFYELDKRWSQYSMGWMSCDGSIYLSEDVTEEYLDNLGSTFTSGRLGFVSTKTKRPQWVINNGKGKAGKWLVQGYFRTSSVSRGIEIPNLSTVLAST